MKKKFLILAQSYSENDGGYIALHKLCDQINQLGGDAFMHPYIDNFEFNAKNWINPILKFGKERLRRLMPYKINPLFKTPVLRDATIVRNNEDWIIVYPEVVFGNPLQAKNVVRWFLHHPGHITGKVYYGDNELYFAYHSGINVRDSLSSSLSKLELKIIHYPLNFYNKSGVSKKRMGTAYCLRKGKHKILAHDLTDSVLIDGKTHEEISVIFKRVKHFISYDIYTAYSHFAVLCGCESIIIPDTGICETEWFPNPQDRYGLSYGFENLEKSKLTRNLLIERIQRDENRNLVNASDFIREASSYFKQFPIAIK